MSSRQPRYVQRVLRRLGVPDRGRDHTRDRDEGMTLVELLVSVMVTGTIVAVLSSAIVVFYRQRPATEGRLNVARAEQSVGLWVPADLASATTVDTDPAASPCGTACPPNVVLNGSNAMMLTSRSKEMLQGCSSLSIFPNAIKGVFLTPATIFWPIRLRPLR